MSNGSEDEGQSPEITVNAYRIAQLKKQLEELKANTETLNLEQIKQMGIWLGVPVAGATGVFGLVREKVRRHTGIKVDF